MAAYLEVTHVSGVIVYIVITVASTSLTLRVCADSSEGKGFVEEQNDAHTRYAGGTAAAEDLPAPREAPSDVSRT